MPKIVDHDQRRAELSGALWRVVWRDGVGHLTIRNIAKEAGVAIGSVHYYFESQDELLVYSLAESFAAAKQRIAKVTRTRRDFDAYCAAFCQLVPVTPRQRKRAAIWIEVLSKARTQPELAKQVAEAHAVMQGMIHDLLKGMQESGLLSPSVDLEAMTRTTNVFVNGLIVEAVCVPSALGPKAAKQVLSDYLRGLVEHSGVTPDGVDLRLPVVLSG